MTKTARTLSHIAIALGFSFLVSGAGAQSKPDAASPLASTLPDIIGIRPGMSAQEAYNALKARHAGIKIGVGQFQLQRLGDKPIVTQIAAQVVDAAAPETITVWLTTPPGKQVVFAVGRVLEYDPNSPLLRNKVVESLRQKYGPETDNGTNQVYWAFDEQGKRPDASRMKQMNCMNIAHGSVLVAPPQGSTYNAATPVMYSPEAATPCDSFIKVNAQLDGTGGLDQTYVRRITVTIRDLALERRSQEAYQAYLASLANNKSKEELEKAKQRAAPSF